MKEIDFTLYQPGVQQDSVLVYWYMKLIHTGELHKVFGEIELSRFLRLFQWPNQLIYALKTDLQPEEPAGYFWYASWFEPIFDGAFFGMWVDPSRRQSKFSLYAFELAIQYGLSRWPILLGVTKQQKLIDPHLRMGYTLLGKLPHFWGKEDSWVLYLTREGFDNRDARLYIRSNHKWAAESKEA